MLHGMGARVPCVFWQHPMSLERWIAVVAIIIIATAMALLFLGWEHQYAR